MSLVRMGLFGKLDIRLDTPWALVAQPAKGLVNTTLPS